MKKKWTPHIAAVMSLVVFVMLGLASANTPEAPSSEPQTPQAKQEALLSYNSESDFKIDWDTNVKDGIVITGYTGTRKEVSIPPTIQNNPVTSIGEKAFYDNYDITRVIIPDSVKSIGNRAFIGCEKLTSITIPNSVTSIGQTAFAACTSLTSVTIGNNVTSIGSETFSGCSSLASVTIPNSVTSIGNGAFQNTDLTSITIPGSVTSIGNNVINGCTNLTSVTFQGRTSNLANASFPGDLRAKYLANDGGPGTYTRFANGDVWRKQ